MRNISILLSFIIVLFASKAHSQSRFYLSTETNFIYDLYQVTDEGNAAGPPNIRTLDWPGFTLIAGYELNSVLSLETGMALRPAKSGYSLMFENGGGMKSEGGAVYYHIPVKTRARIPLLKDCLFATASLGVHLSVTDPGRLHLKEETGNEGSSSMIVDGNIIYSSSAKYTSFNKYFLTAAADVGLEYQIHPKFKIYSTLTYNRGFTDLEKAEIQYQYVNQPEREATVIHQGSYLSVNIGLRFHFNSGN